MAVVVAGFVAVESPSVVGRLLGVSVVERPDEPPKLTVVSPKDALRLARALPGVGVMAIEGLTAEEWQAFEAALAER